MMRSLPLVALVFTAFLAAFQTVRSAEVRRRAVSSSTERIQDSTAAVKRLATKYNCDIVGRNLADNLVEIKRKNKRALDDLKLHCEVSLAQNDDKLAASNRRADDIENAARPTAMETFKWEHNNATADFESVESEHSEIVRNHKNLCVETKVALENATLELADADEALASTSKIIGNERSAGKKMYYACRNINVGTW